MTSNQGMQATNERVVANYRNGTYSSPEGMPFVLITVTGRKSGQRRTFPLAVAADGDDLVIVGSRGGTPVHPQWYLNLVADPHVTVEYRGETFDTVAETITEPAHRARLVELMTVSLPPLPRYEQKAAPYRQIPVVLLRRPDAAG